MTDMIMWNLSSTSEILAFVLIPWLAAELMFAVVFYRVLVPRFQLLRPPADYRDYAPRDRCKLLIRILNRIEANCLADKTQIKPAVHAYLANYFSPVSSSSANDTAAIPHHGFSAKKGDADQVLAWAFFGKRVDELEPWMKQDMDRMYEILESNYGFSLPEGSTPEYKPMLSSLDPLNIHYRPFLIYGWFSLMKIMSDLLLRAAGFYACRSTGGLKYFYRPPKQRSGNNRESTGDGNRLPLIFFHGIAPGGLAFYIPMLFYLGGDGRPLFFFENPDIAFSLFGGNPLNEDDTVHGIWEAVDHHLGSVQDVSVVGHSLGSCPVTWLVHSTNSSRIRQIVLVDPVSICLYHADSMKNFLYQGSDVLYKIGFVSNEIFTQHYLRRHFAWYNSELWLDDLPKQAKVLVCLSEEDCIVSVQKIQQQILRTPEVDFLLWEDAGHADCISRPNMWRQIQMMMRRQERLIVRGSLSSDVDKKKDL